MPLTVRIPHEAWRALAEPDITIKAVLDSRKITTTVRATKALQSATTVKIGRGYSHVVTADPPAINDIHKYAERVGALLLEHAGTRTTGRSIKTTCARVVRVLKEHEIRTRKESGE